jgi:hypothetical protein
VAIGAGPTVPAEAPHVAVEKCNNPASHFCAFLALTLKIVPEHERLDE